MATWSPDNVILTEIGRQILSKVQAGVGAITVTRIVTGGTIIPYAQLYKATSIPDIKQECTILSVSTDMKGSEISVSVSNEDLEESYSLYTLGIYVTHPDFEGEQLYFVAECNTDNPDVIPLPSVTIATMYYSLYMVHENTSNVTITVSTAGVVTIDMINKPGGVASLGSDGKVLPEQLPKMDVSTAMAGFDTKDSLADADGIVITDSAEDNTGKRVLWSKVKELLGKLYVPLTRTINKKALSSDITLSAADVGAAAASHTHALDALTGILPVNKGGTGQSSLEALLAALKQAGAVQIATGSYVGTGTFGADHPCSLTFDFVPKLIMITRYHTGTSSIDYIFPGDSEGNYWLMDTSLIPTSETSKWSDYIGTGLGRVYGYGGGSSIGYKSLDGKTAYWYSGSDAASQFNSGGTTYYYAAIG